MSHFDPGGYLRSLPVITPEFEEDEDFPAQGDDVSERIDVSWYDNVVRIATIGDGNCFIHAVLKAYWAKYQESEEYSSRTSWASLLRRDLALLLETENPEFPGYTYWESVSEGQFPSLLMQELADPNLVSVLNVDYSIEGLKALLNSKTFLGDEIYKFISDALGIDIYIFRIDENDLYLHLNTSYKDSKRNAITIAGNGVHYEVIGVIHPEGIQTIYGFDDPFIQAIREKIDFSPTPVFDPREKFIQNAIDIFTVRKRGELDPEIRELEAKGLVSKEDLIDSYPIDWELKIPYDNMIFIRDSDIFKVLLSTYKDEIEENFEIKRAINAEEEFARIDKEKAKILGKTSSEVYFLPTMGTR